MVRKSISMLLFVLLAATLFVLPAAASYESEADSGIAPRYTLFREVNTKLSVSGTEATLIGIIKGQPGVSQLVYTVYLQIKNGNGWIDISQHSGNANSVSTSYSFSDFVRSGASFRTKTIVTAYSGSQSETVTVYSGEQVV